MKQYLSISQAAEYVSVAPITIRRWIDDGTLARYQIGRVVRVDAAELDDKLASCAT